MFRLGFILITIVILAACAPTITSRLQDEAQAGEPYSYAIEATNNPETFTAALPPPEGLRLSGNVISGQPSDAGEFSIPISASNSAGSDNKILKLNIKTAAHPVDFEDELVIIRPEIVRDESLVGVGQPLHFKEVVTALVPEGGDVDEFAEAWFQLWASEQVLSNGHKTDAIPAATARLREAWENDGFELLAVVNRIDLTRFDDNVTPIAMGEGRLVYGLKRQGSFTIIFEYGLPRRSNDITMDLGSWAASWHALGEPGLTDTEYLSELVEITGEYASGLSLNQVRTNHLFGRWDLREFHLEGDRLAQAAVAQTPDVSLNDSAQFRDFVIDNEALILSGRHEIPGNMLSAMAPTPTRWQATGADERARMVVAFNTCSGCHQNPEVPGVPFQHIKSAGPVNAAAISDFLRGEVTLAHPLPGSNSRTHNERESRIVLLSALVDLGRNEKLVSVMRNVKSLERIIQERANRVH